MRKTILAVLVMGLVGGLGCGGSSSRQLQHPTLDQDYSGRFVGVWTGTGTITADGQTQTSPGTQPIVRTGSNTLSLTDMCPGIPGLAGLDGPGTFTMDPLTCPPVNEPCGPVTLSYQSGVGQLATNTLAITIKGTISGCGRTVDFTGTFAGTLPPAPGPDHGPPSAVAATALSTTAGTPLALDARASSDPDGRVLQFAWTVLSQPTGAAPTLSGASTATPTFTATVEGNYALQLVVAADDGQSATLTVAVSVTPAPVAVGTSVHLQSDVGDYIGGGAAFAYTRADSQIALNAVGGHLAVSITGDQRWSADFVVPANLSALTPGTYANLKRYPFNDAAVGGLSWSGEGRGCNTLTGWFTIDGATYQGGVLTALDLRFEQHCEGGAPALHGQIHYVASDTTIPPGPVSPPPADLWRAAPGSVPASGNYVYLASQAGDYVGIGQTLTYTPADAALSVSGASSLLTVSVTGDERWSGSFQPMSGLSRLEPGYYGDLQRYPFQNPVRGGLSWSGEGRGCNTLTGWFVVDSVTYSGSALTAIDLRFEQHCEGAAPALQGQIHWSASDTTKPPGPVSPPPADLWQAAPGAVPASGNYVYLISDTGDYIGAGQTHSYTPAEAGLSVTASAGHLSVAVTGDESWWGDFQAMNTLTALQPGYYGNLERYPFQNPVRGGLSWWGEGRGCNTLTGWFVVDSVTYSGTALTAIDVRFEQHCEGGAAALHGQIHWSTSDTTKPPGPVSPPPADLWQAAPGAVPASGNYVYLISDAGDYIGAGQTHSYTPAEAVLSVTASAGHLSVAVTGHESWWGDFQAMNTLTALQPGYYGNLERYPFQNPARGGLSWSGEGRGCNTLTGWFVVDSVTYSGSALTAIALRFEQHCEGMAPALHGQIHWTASGT